MTDPALLDRAPADELYERDFHLWCLRQARLLKERRFAELDLDNVVEELESLGREQAAKLYSSYRVLLMHLLKWAWQPRRRTRGWQGTIVRERLAAARQLAQNPGLKPRRAGLFADAYAAARKEAAAETGIVLAAFPETCPFTIEQALDEAFWPERTG